MPAVVVLCHPNIQRRIEKSLCHHFGYWFLPRSRWGGTCSSPWTETDLSFAALAIPAHRTGSTEGDRNPHLLGRRWASLLSMQKEIYTTNTATKGKVFFVLFCNSIVVYSRSFKIQKVVQLFTLFGKENEQIYVARVIGLRGKVNKRCCF